VSGFMVHGMSWSKITPLPKENCIQFVSIEVWGSELANTCMVFHLDSMAVVYIISKQTSKNPNIMRLVRRFVVSCMKYNMLPKAVHIQGNNNVLADLLSRFRFQEFRKRAPFMHDHPTTVDPNSLSIN
jgi:hypothetical protein